MDLNRILPGIKWIFSRVGIIYMALFVALACLVDVKAAESRIKMRRLNDARPPMNSLVSLTKGEMLPAAIEWKPYRRYFELVLRYMPDEWTARMFLGICEHYQGEPQKAVMDMRRSAESFLPLFWSSYNAAVLTFQGGDMPKALDYAERALRVSPAVVDMAMRSSVIYRQIMFASNFDIDISRDLASAREDLYLLRTAAQYYIKDFNASRAAALQAVAESGIQDKEPFYFFAGASDIGLGNTTEALSLLGVCLKLKSRNPLAYRYAGDILSAVGKAEEARSLWQLAGGLQRHSESSFPYASRLRLRFM
ncbi:MAG: hypothetical protein WCI27_05895 [Candidatus Omnitrophota bacterium]